MSGHHGGQNQGALPFRGNELAQRRGRHQICDLIVHDHPSESAYAFGGVVGGLP